MIGVSTTIHYQNTENLFAEMFQEKGGLLGGDVVLWVSFVQKLCELWNTGVHSTAKVSARSRFFFRNKDVGATNILHVGNGDRTRQHLHAFHPIYEEFGPCRMLK